MPERQFRVGDRVRLTTRHPNHGYDDPAVFSEVGTIINQLIFADWTVNFPSHQGFTVDNNDIALVERTRNENEEETKDEPTYRCEWCSTEVPENEICYDRQGVGICDSCQEEAIQCGSCENWTTEWCECVNYCPDCHREHCHSRLIHDYHTSKCHRRRFLPDDKQDLYLGIELEMEQGSGDIQDIAEALHPLSKDESIFLMEHDASLCDGLEIVSEPATLAYHKTQFGWDKIISTAKDNNAISHDQGRCGLHIHFNISFFDHNQEAIDLNSAKLLYFFERFWQPLVKFSRRTNSQLNENARQYGSNLDRTTPKYSCDYAKMCGRYYAINLQNDKTIEIRIFRGTLEPETFYACLELVDFLARYVKKHTIHYIQRIAWAKVVRAIKAKDYPYLIKYLERRELLDVPNHS